MRGKILGHAGGVVELLELVVILLFWFFHTPVKVYAQAFATPACPNTSPLPLVRYFYHTSSSYISFVRSLQLFSYHVFFSFLNYHRRKDKKVKSKSKGIRKKKEIFFPSPVPPSVDPITLQHHSIKF